MWYVGYFGTRLGKILQNDTVDFTSSTSEASPLKMMRGFWAEWYVWLDRWVDISSTGGVLLFAVREQRTTHPLQPLNCVSRIDTIRAVPQTCSVVCSGASFRICSSPTKSLSHPCCPPETANPVCSYWLPIGGIGSDSDATGSLHVDESPSHFDEVCKRRTGYQCWTELQELIIS
jgi:hypothetical protein